MGYPQMRRKNRAISEEEARALLRDGEYGVLSTVGADGLPAGVPLSYVLDGDGIVFHCALAGRKVDNLRHQPGVSFVVVGKVQAAFVEGDYTTYYESAVVHGTAAPVENPEEKARLLRLLCEKYLSEHMDAFEAAIQRSLKATGVWRIHIDHLTGKAKR